MNLNIRFLLAMFLNIVVNAQNNQGNTISNQAFVKNCLGLHPTPLEIRHVSNGNHLSAYRGSTRLQQIASCCMAGIYYAFGKYKLSAS